MKSKKRSQSSSEESEESAASVKSSSTSDSESEDSSVSEHRHKKKRKRADSSQSDSDTEDQKRSKKRKHKKKKKKHGKKKRRSDSVESISAEEFSMSDGEISSKKKRKHKHKHSKRARSSSASNGEDRGNRRLHSVVKERHASSEGGSQPSRTYYQGDYRRSESGDERNYERESEVQRFYRGSSKDRSHHSYEHYKYEREHPDKYGPIQDQNYKAKYAHSAQFSKPNEDFVRRPREFDEYKRRYEERRPQEDYHHGRPREEQYHPRVDQGRGFHQNRYNPYEDRSGPKRREFDNGRNFKERRPPPEQGHFREREFPEKRYQERFNPERPRDVRRERPGRPDKPPLAPPPRVSSRSRSPEDRYREQRNRKPEPRVERDERYRDNRGDSRRDDRVEPRERENKRDSREDKQDSREDKRESREEKRSEEKRGSGEERRGDERRERPERSADRKDDRPPVRSEAISRERKSRFGPQDNQEYSWGKTEVKKEGDGAPDDKEKPNFGLSGKLTADANTVNGVVIKYTEPDDAKQPKRRWRFYPFKGDKALPILYIHRQSAFLIGRDKKVVDIMLEHPSISKQHSALQYRATPFTRPDGSQGRRVRPYIIDLESANGTFVNNKKIEPRRYVELLERDVVKFGFSQREYVLLHENSKDEAQDDDNQDPVAVTTTDKIKNEKRVKQELAEDGE